MRSDGSASDRLLFFRLEDLPKIVKPHVSAEVYDDVNMAISAQLAEFNPEDLAWWQ